MKKSSTLLIAVALILSSCGTMAQYASSDSGQQFNDGIYSNTPAFRTKGAKEESESKTKALVEKTKESTIYLFGDKKDTVMIPQNMSATIKYDQKLGGTVVTVEENQYDWRYNLENSYGYYYGPYSIGSSWYWSRHYNPWYSWSYSPWRYYGWYDPWYYGSYYDPWYYGGWYDPWYYGGWYDPWYYHHHHYYYGHHHHHHPLHHGPGYMPDRPGHRNDRWYGNRQSTGSDRVFTSSTSLRGGGGSRSTISRNATVASGTPARAERVTANRSSVVRSTPAVRSKAAAPSRVSGTLVRTSAASASRLGTASGRPAVTTSGKVFTRPSGVAGSTSARPSVQSSYRRPSAATNSTVSSGTSRPSSGTSTVSRSSSSGRQSYSSGSSGSRSSSSYSRSSSSSSSRSSYSSGSSSSGRSGYSSGRSSSGGGGYSRSGGSSRR